MKRWLIIGSIVFLVAAAGAWHWLRPGDPLSQANRLLAAGNTRGAVLVLQGAVLNRPQDARLHYALAEVELRSQDPVAAEREARAASASGWDPKAVEVVLAQAILQQQRYDDVLRDYQPDPAMTPEQASTVLVQRGLAQLALNHGSDAASSIAEAQRRNPRSYAAAMAGAQLARAETDPAAEQRQVELALSINPNDPPALLLRSSMLVAAGDLQGALAADNAAVTHSGDAPLPLLTRADLLIGLGNDAAARADVDKVLAVSPDNPLANYMLAQLLVDARDWPAADAALDKAGSILDRLPRSSLYVALVKANLQQPQQALDAAQHYLAQVGNADPGAIRLVAAIQLQLGRPAAAIALLEPLVDSGHADTHTLQVMASAYWQSGKPQLAVQLLQQAAQAEPGNAAVLTELAAIRMGQGNASGAALDLQQVLDLKHAPGGNGVINANLSQTGATPSSPNPIDTATALIKAAVRAGDIQSAEATLQRLRQMSGVAPAQLDELQGLVSLAKLDTAGARTAFEAAVKAQPNDIAAQVELARVIALQGDGPRAEQILTTLADQHPTNDGVLSSLEVVLIGDGKQDQAIARFAKAHAAAPADTWLRRRRWRC
jgi:putative PEP-CTERM system TPR-repeat lipoprotein